MVKIRKRGRPGLWKLVLEARHSSQIGSASEGNEKYRPTAHNVTATAPVYIPSENWLTELPSREFEFPYHVLLHESSPC